MVIATSATRALIWASAIGKLLNTVIATWNVSEKFLTWFTSRLCCKLTWSAIFACALRFLTTHPRKNSIRLPRREHFWYWQERCLLRSGPTLKLCEMPNPSIAEETCSSTRVHTLPNVRADALIDRAEKLLEAPTLDSPQKIESWLKESLTLRPDDFGSWMMLGNLYLRQSQRERALAAYRRAANATPPSPVRRAIEEQIVLVSTHLINTVAALRDPTME